jgi:2-iminoacetate synthase
MFSAVYGEKSAEVRGILQGVQCPSVGRVEELVAQPQLGLAELGELLEIGRYEAAIEQFELLRSYVMQRWRNAAGSRVRYVAPIYVSSFCVDACPYCNFSATRKDTVRHRLTTEELGIEIEAAMARDARVIELVYATDPELDQKMLVQHISQAVEAVGDREGAGVLLCTEYQTSEMYEALRAAGLQGIVQWDETLHEEAYMRWHAASPRKKEFKLRMDNHDRAMAAGLDVAAGALFGLADFRFDGLMQIARARYFKAEYGRGPFVMGTARLKPINGKELKFSTIVSDHAYETALLVYKLAVPEAGRWLQTRETFAMNLRNVLDGDVYTYRCGEVQPGGYTQIQSKSDAGAQFGVNELERGFVEGELGKQGFTIDYEWMPGTAVGREALA